MVNPQSSRLSDGTEINSNEFHAYCLSLATRIDAAIWNNEVPGNTQELALTLNHVGQRRCDDQTKAVIMTLMMSVKSACELGWFPQRESQQLLDLVDSMLKSFTGPENIASSLTPNGPVTLIPQGLFVFRTENISNSSCIIHPQEVSFSLNGREVDKRHFNSMDSRPQRPTNLYNLLIPGTNLLQTLGCFGGSYFIVIAFLHDIPLPVYPSLKDYVHSKVTESACDIPKGSSRISLSCPISRKRIKLPVKGHVCKHLQCFDFWNYIKINTKIPSWCCPHCNQSVCYTDIRLDQSMIKILEEVGSNAPDVVISPDGSWKVVSENNENVMESSGSTQTIPMLNQSSTSMEALPQLPQTLNVYDGQQQFMNFPVSGAGAVIHMPFLPTSLPQDRIATHISMPAAHSSQYQGLHVSPLGLSLGRTSGMMERWNNHNYGHGITQTQLPSPLHHQYLIPPSITYPQTFAFNYGGTSDQRHMQRQNPGGAWEQFSSREFMNLTPDNSANRRPQIQMMRGRITPGSTRYDHLIIQPIQRHGSLTSSNTSSTSANILPSSNTSSTSSFFGASKLSDGY